MSEIKPFKGILYNSQKTGDISRVVTPPYDVISPEEQEKYYARDEHNIIRIILGKTEQGDNQSDNRYTRAAAYMKAWSESSVLKEDPVPSLYVYQQEFTYRKKKYSRKGFIGALRMGQKSSVKVHENTFQGPKDDRLELIKATAANTEPIFLLYKGYSVSVPEQEPMIDIKDDSGVSHRLWRVSDEAETAEFCRDIKGAPFYIADGHHRFETAQNYAKLMKVDASGNDPRNFVMSFCVEQDDEGLLVLPIHRLLNISDEDIDIIMKAAKNYFLIVEVDSFEKIEKAAGHVFGFVNKKTGKLHMFKLRDTVAKDRIMAEKGKSDLKDLEVSILHSLLLDDVLEKYKGGRTQEVVSYSHDENEAISSVKKGRHSCAFLLKPTKVSQVLEIADRGGRMPQKSTFFYPKALSGLVMRKFEQS